MNKLKNDIINLLLQMKKENTAPKIKVCSKGDKNSFWSWRGCLKYNGSCFEDELKLRSLLSKYCINLSVSAQIIFLEELKDLLEK